MNRLATVQ